MSTYWFRKRRGLLSKDLGWGWTPIALEGWLTVLGLVAVIVLIALLLFTFDIFGLGSESVSSGILFLIITAFIVAVSAYIASKKTRP